MARPNATGSPAASDDVTARGGLRDWRPGHWVALALIACVGLALRLLLLPTEGLKGDIDQFVTWVHGIAVGGLANTYDQNVSFPPVMVYIWTALATLEPAFRIVTDSSDASIRVLMKAPATIADFGLAGLVAYAFRNRPWWAVVGAAVILLHPAVMYISAWWGQYESIYALPLLLAALLASNGRNGWAAAAIAVAVMTKPQALPFLLPFAAWFLATDGWRGVARATAIGAGMIVLLWLPFLAAGGPLRYLENLAEYQGETFAILSLRAWNVWWLVQEAAAGGSFIADDTAVLGPLTLRHVGFMSAGLLELVVALALFRSPTPRTLYLALAASALVAFTFLTTMHERYAYGALPFLALLIAAPYARWLFPAFAILFTLNLVAAVPPSPAIASLVPISGFTGIAGSIGMVAITAASVVLLSRNAPQRDATGPA
jgi:dolichyl-phosphate-mannose-protein mannosyltransferase